MLRFPFWGLRPVLLVIGSGSEDNDAMHSVGLFVILALGATICASCAFGNPSHGWLRHRAEKDLDCRNVELSEKGHPDRFLARGCGREASYGRVWEGNQHRWVREH